MHMRMVLRRLRCRQWITTYLAVRTHLSPLDGITPHFVRRGVYALHTVR